MTTTTTTRYIGSVYFDPERDGYRWTIEDEEYRDTFEHSTEVFRDECRGDLDAMRDLESDARTLGLREVSRSGNTVTFEGAST